MSRWMEVGQGNHVLTTEGSKLNTGLIIGAERAMVGDRHRLRTTAGPGDPGRRP
ncbi:hypothetical protein JOE31_001346 [Arthrobacter sp. PvP023]|nr:hypothetical protein [Arthrobacter sp. PvP023]